MRLYFNPSVRIKRKPKQTKKKLQLTIDKFTTKIKSVSHFVLAGCPFISFKVNSKLAHRENPPWLMNFVSSSSPCCEMCWYCNISNTRNSVSYDFQTTRNAPRFFSQLFEVFRNRIITLFRVFDVTSQTINSL